MTMAARWRSPRILDSAKTAMARLHSNLLNDCGKTAILAHQHHLQFGNTAMSAHRLLDKDGAQRISELFDSTLFLGW
jgi:hypothetical protein